MTNNVKRRKLIFTIGLGIALGYLLKKQITQFKKLSPDDVLDIAKNTFMKHGPVNGSWIYMTPEKLEKNGLTYNVYRGGITRTIDGENKQYEFFADAETGAVIDVTS